MKLFAVSVETDQIKLGLGPISLELGKWHFYFGVWEEWDGPAKDRPHQPRELLWRWGRPEQREFICTLFDRSADAETA